MTVRKLRDKLYAEGVNPDAYSLCDGLKNDAIVLEHVYGRWNVFYYEKGSRRPIKSFRSEGKACTYLYNLLTGEPSAKW